MATQEVRIKALIDAIAVDIVTLLDSLTTSGVQRFVTLDSQDDTVTTMTIEDDDTDTATWPNRWEWKYRERTGGTLGFARLVQWINEYGELRVAPAKVNTVALRVYAALVDTDPAHEGPVFSIENNRDENEELFTVDGDGNVDTAGVVTAEGGFASNAGITSVGAIQRVVPSGPTLSTGYIILSAAAAVPTNTPANTIIFRTAT